MTIRIFLCLLVFSFHSVIIYGRFLETLFNELLRLLRERVAPHDLDGHLYEAFIRVDHFDDFFRAVVAAPFFMQVQDGFAL